MLGKVSSGRIFIADEFLNNLPNLLIAPTYNKDLNLMEDLMNHERELLDLSRNFNIIFKPHPVLPKKYPEQFDFMHHMSEESSGIDYVEESHSDISDYIIWSDVVLGDCSGALILALASCKPIVAYDNPDRCKSPYFDPDGVEWTKRDKYAYRINSFQRIQTRLKTILSDDFLLRDRRELRDLIYGESVDGQSAKRIALNIKEVLENV